MSNQPVYLKDLEAIASGVVAREAVEVDRTAKFPSAAIEALGRCGILGLMTAKDAGGLGLGIGDAVTVVERLARECPSTAMVVVMHYCGALVLEKHGDEKTRRAIARGEHLSTLAWSEAGSRGEFWVPVSEARDEGTHVVLNARKSFATAAGHATAWVWSSRPLRAEGLSTIWLVPRATDGIRVGPTFEGLGLRGNDSSPIVAEGAKIPKGAMLGEDGGGRAIMVEIVLAPFNTLSGACSVGIMEAATSRTIAHVSSASFEHHGTRLRDLSTIRAYVARMRIQTDMARCLVKDTVEALSTGRPDAMVRVMEVKPATGEAALTVTELAMRVCGGAAYRKDVGVDRGFRDARASTIMAPTTDQLYDFLGRAVTDMPMPF